MGFVVLVICTGATLWATGALAVFPDSNVDHYTGCLNTKVSPGGTFVNVAQGDSPSKACGSGQVLVHLSGGDITNVATASGSGLAGGTDNGKAALSLNSSGCSDGGVLKWSTSTLSWACGSDNDNTYTGSDFALSNQNCASGLFAKGVDASGDLSCGSPGPPDAYLAGPSSGGVLSSESAEKRELASLNVPAGTYSVVGKIHLQNQDRDSSAECEIPGVDTEGTAIQQRSDTDTSEFFHGGNITLVGVVSFSQAGTIHFTCGTFDAGVQYSGLKILATRVTAR